MSKAYLGMEYKYVREVPTTLAVTIRQHDKGPVSRDLPKLAGLTSRTATMSSTTAASSSSRRRQTARRQTVSMQGPGRADAQVIFDGEGSELFTMTPNFISLHHSISGTHGGLDCFKASVHSGCEPRSQIPDPRMYWSDAQPAASPSSSPST